MMYNFDTRAIIFDIDGTLADCGWRLHHIKNKPKNWKAFFDGIPHDKPVRAINLLGADLCFDQLNFKVLFCTGRVEKYRDMTVKWLNEHVGGFAGDRPLYMRKNGDFRGDVVVKKELLAKMREDGFDPLMVFDDKPDVCHMYAEEGLLVLQVLNGNTSEVD